MTGGLKPCRVCGCEYFKIIGFEFWQCENCGCRTDSIENVVGADLNSRNLTSIPTADLVKELIGRDVVTTMSIPRDHDGIDIRCWNAVGEFGEDGQCIEVRQELTGGLDLRDPATILVVRE
jgi:hypothetical protein